MYPSASFATITMYWDANGTGVGATNSTTATGTWGTNTYWTLDNAGLTATRAWIPASDAVFAAGSNATGTYTVTVSGMQAVRNLTVRNGTITFSTGTLQIAPSAEWNNSTANLVSVTAALRYTNTLTLKSGLWAITSSASVGTGGVTIDGSDVWVSSGHANSFGTGTLTLKNGKLSADSTTAIAFVAPLQISGSITLGDFIKTGALSFGAGQSIVAPVTITALSSVAFNTTVTWGSNALIFRGPGLVTEISNVSAGINTGNITVGDGTTFSGNNVGGNLSTTHNQTSFGSGAYTINYGGTLNSIPVNFIFSNNVTVNAGGKVGIRGGSFTVGTWVLNSLSEIYNQISGDFIGNANVTFPRAGALFAAGINFGIPYPSLTGTMAFGGSAFGNTTSSGSAATLSSDAGSVRTIAFNKVNSTFQYSAGLILNAPLLVTGTGNTGLTGMVPTGASGALGTLTQDANRDLTIAMAPAGMASVTGSTTGWRNTTLSSGTLLVNADGLGNGTFTINGGTFRLGTGISKAVSVGTSGGVLESAGQSYSGALTGGVAGDADLVIRAVGNTTTLSGNNGTFAQGFTLATAGTPREILFTTTDNATGSGGNTIVVPSGIAFGFDTAARASAVISKFSTTTDSILYWSSLSADAAVNLSSGGLNKDVWIGLGGGANSRLTGYTLPDSGANTSNFRLVPIAASTLSTTNLFTGANNLIVSTGATPTDTHSSPTNLFGSGITLTISAAQNYTGTTTVQGGVKNALMGGGVTGPTLTVSADLSAAGAVTIDRSATVNISGAGGKFSGTSGITVKGGSTLVLGDTTAANNNGVTNRVSTAGGLTLGGTSGGGTTTFRFADSGNTTSHSLSALTIAAGSSTLNSGGITAANPGSGDLIFAGGANAVRNPGGIAFVTPPSATNLTGTCVSGSPVISGISDTSRITLGQYLSISGGNFDPSSGNEIYAIVLSKTANTVTMDLNAGATVGAPAAITSPYANVQFTNAPLGSSVIGTGSRAILVGAFLSQGGGLVVPVAAASGYLGAPTLDVKATTSGAPTFAMSAGENVFLTQSDSGSYGVTTTISGSDLGINSFTGCNRGGATIAFDTAARILTIASGELTFTKNPVSLTIGSSGIPGEIRTGNGQDLIFNTGNTIWTPGFTVYSKIGQEGGTDTRALTKAGAGTLTLSNANNQIGDIYVNGGTVTGSGGLNRLGDVDNTARTWYLFGGGIKTDSIASSANRTSIVVGPQGGYIVQTQSSPSGTLQIGTTTGPNATAITLNGTLYIGGNELGGDPSLYSTQLKGNISGSGTIFASGHSNTTRKHVLTLSGVNTAWSGGIYCVSTLPFSNINNTYSGNAVIRVDNTDALGTGPINMDSGGNGFNSMGMTFTANAGSSYANDFRLNMAMYFQNWKTNGPLSLSGRIVGTSGLLLQGYDAGGGNVSETVLAGTVSMNGTPNANGGAVGSVGTGQYYNYGTASVIQNFVNGQGGVNVGATALIGTTTLVAGHINSMLSYNSLTTVESVGAEGYVRFSGTNSFIPGAVGPGYLAALRKGGSTVLNYGYLLTAGSTYTPPQGKSFVIGTLGTGTAQVGTLGGAGSGTANFDGGTKHDASTGELLAGLYGGDVNIHGNASGDTASLNLLAKDADTVLVLGNTSQVVFCPTWGDSGGQSCLTLMRKRTGTTTLYKVGAGTLVVAEADYIHTDGTSARAAFTWNVDAGTVIYKHDDNDDGIRPDFAAFNVNTGAVLGGSGVLNASVSVVSGTINPGDSSGTAALTIKSLTLNSSSATVAFDLNGDTVGTQYDQLVIPSTGDGVVLNNATLVVALGYSPVVGKVFTIINRQSAGAVTGTFNNLAEGATVVSTGTIRNFTISYIGGDGNDVTLTAQ